VPADVIVLATGFKVLQFLWPMDIVGKSGTTLREQWVSTMPGHTLE